MNRIDLTNPDGFALSDGTLAGVAELAQAAAVPAELETGKVYTIGSGQQQKLIDLTGDQYRDRPARTTGTVQVSDVDSLHHYWQIFADDRAQVYADRDAQRLIAVLDHADSMSTDWGKHRIVLQLRQSEAWAAWAGRDNKLTAQADFAEFLEDNRADIFDPASADLLEIAQSLQATTNASFKSGYKLVNGQKQLTYTETVSATAGENGTLAIPEVFTLRLPVYRGADVADEVIARLRYRIGNGQLVIGFKLYRPADVVDAAFNGVVQLVAEKIGRPVLRGTPA